MNNLPWTVDKYEAVVDCDGRMVEANGFATVVSPGDRQDESKERSAFIVKAVNSHDALVEALRQIAAFDDTEASDVLARTGKYGSFDEPGAVAIARVALAGIKKGA